MASEVARYARFRYVLDQRNGEHHGGSHRKAAEFLNLHDGGGRFDIKDLRLPPAVEASSEQCKQLTGR